MCAVCHENQGLGLVKGVHAHAGEKDEQGRGTVLDCRKCHGANQHHILPVADSRSPVFVNHQVETCGKCHEKQRDSYANTSHGHGLYQSGLLGHRHLRQLPRRPRHLSGGRRSLDAVPANVATTCGKCHRFIAERLARAFTAEARGRAEWPKGWRRAENRCSSQAAPPVIKGTKSAWPPRRGFAEHCPISAAIATPISPSRYAMSIHGELTELGYQPAANCYDCHGSHSIQAVDQSGLSVVGQ